MAFCLLDTDILIDFLRGRESARLLMARFESAAEIPFISTVSVAELMAGTRAGEEGATEALLSLLEKIPVSESIARSAGSLLNIYRKRHGMELADALIAATSLALGATLLTRNVRHYPMPELKLERPY